MPRLHHSEVEDHLAEDHTCQGCDRDREDCVCMQYFDDLDLFPDIDEPMLDDDGGYNPNKDIIRHSYQYEALDPFNW